MNKISYLETKWFNNHIFIENQLRISAKYEKQLFSWNLILLKYCMNFSRYCIHDEIIIGIDSTINVFINVFIINVKWYKVKTINIDKSYKKLENIKLAYLLKK